MVDMYVQFNGFTLMISISLDKMWYFNA